jgi:hypothetical protein
LLSTVTVEIYRCGVDCENLARFPIYQQKGVGFYFENVAVQVFAIPQCLVRMLEMRYVKDDSVMNRPFA